MWVETARSHDEPQHWYSPSLWQTMTADAWWRMLARHGYRVSRRSLPRFAVISAVTTLNSLVGLLQSALYVRRLRAAAVAPDPVFIVGHYRSGTTHLHNLLALDERLSLSDAV